MFDISSGQLMLVFIIGLVVLGPSRLPVVVRTVSGWLRTLRSLTTRVQDELNQDLKQLELEEYLRKMEKALPDTLPSGLRESMDELREVTASMTPAPSPRPKESEVPDAECHDASMSGGGETEGCPGTAPLPSVPGPGRPRVSREEPVI